MSLFLEFLVVLVNAIWLWLVAIYKALVPVSMQWTKDMSKDTVLVTGAGSGIGRLMSLKFAEMGCRLVIWDINEEGNLETARQIEAKGSKVKAYTVDLSNKESIYETAAKVKADVGNVDVLVNNAGIVTGRKFLDCPDGLVEKTMEVNTNAHFWTTKSFLPEMMERNHGHIVTIASSAGLFGVATLADYCASKFGAVGFDESIRSEMLKYRKTGVHTTVVCPFFIKTGMFEGAKSRFPWLLPLLEPEYAADKIMDAVRTNQPMLCAPRVLYLLYFLRGVFPSTVADVLAEFIGISASMDDFVGRTKPKTA
ncbi:protein dhs-3 [Aplysia californica]|uniref:Protein dhs-3 n=1 Tax=Aplysia californica TaxID=6500 RepID=A0ABM0K4V3_APLCA|nr:protein dhs-3 [Aplysia californica]